MDVHQVDGPELAEMRRSAAAQERCRITRDLQDLVHHRLSSLEAHGRAAAHAARDLDEQRGRDTLDLALRAVLDLTETALVDLRRFMTGLRTPGAPQ